MATDKNVPEFFKALWDDIIGKNANGRDASFKEWYSHMLLWIIGGGALSMLFVSPWISAGLGVLFAIKLWITMRNTF